MLITLLLLFGATTSYGTTQTDENLSLQNDAQKSPNTIRNVTVGIVMDGESPRTDVIIQRIMK